MAKAFPEEFRRDVVAVARKGEAPITQIAKDFGVSPAALHRWMKIADREDGVKSGAGVVSDDAAKLRKSCAVLWPICPGTSIQNNDVPPQAGGAPTAGPRAGCQGRPDQGSRGSVLLRC